jgi:anti-sigma-K factor RskA
MAEAYALGALEAEERQMVEEYLETCSECAPLFREYMEVAASLALAVPPMNPPHHLRGRIMGQLTPEQHATAEPEPVATVRPPGGNRTRWVISAASIAASVMILFLGGIGVLVLSQQSQVENLQSQIGDMEVLIDEERSTSQELRDRLNEQRLATWIAALPGLEAKSMDNTEEAPLAAGMLLADPGKRWAFLVAQGLEASIENEPYHVWLVNNGTLVNVGRFSVDESGYGQLFIRQSLQDFAWLGVTREPLPGTVESPAVLGVSLE